MGSGKPSTGWRVVPSALWRAFAAPAQSFGAKFCKVWLVAEVAFAVMDVLAPGAGVAYWSGHHLADIAGALADVMVLCMALWFVRQRDEARAEVKAYEMALQGAPLVVQEMRRRAEKKTQG
ncbi:hypothetical protein [Nonomuraea wenchangensis]|uniref:hypothetical protein n=1 Tax=Nonomuraea wenchangensis TaxID=568860 RepID=UPI00332AF519